MENALTAAFEDGRLELAGGGTDLRDRPWNPHPAFAGVELKHLITAAESGGGFSCHLVRIAPGCAIGEHRHDPQLEIHEIIAGRGSCLNAGRGYSCRPGVLSVFGPRSSHSLAAGEDGLLLFAKFIPALC